jgi:hypothetical protein
VTGDVNLEVDVQMNGFNLLVGWILVFGTWAAKGLDWV